MVNESLESVVIDVVIGLIRYINSNCYILAIGISDIGRKLKHSNWISQEHGKLIPTYMFR